VDTTEDLSVRFDAVADDTAVAVGQTGNLLMNAGPNSTTFTLAPILFPTQWRGTAGGFAAGVAKLGATLGVFLLPILKEKYGVPSVLGIISVVSLLGLVVTLILRRKDTE